MKLVRERATGRRASGCRPHPWHESGVTASFRPGARVARGAQELPEERALQAVPVVQEAAEPRSG
jgi:hypothetical protein